MGKVIRLTAGHHAVVEEKPEVKKAGGVYYTPAYIVEYIVKNTVGKLCEGKSPRQIEKVRFLDPACGSGSFLIGAYTYLLNYHRDWYVNDASQKHTKEIYQGTGGQWLLTTQQKKQILLNNIYGVDIDSQAVEVTKLSLLLRVLEGESEETIGKTLKLFRERALPDLGNNIKCGNSLIGPDFYQNQQMSFLDDDDRYRINAFGWNTEFSAIMKSGGFDAVIGNPPYRSLLLGKKQESENPAVVHYYERKLPHSSQYKMNLFGIFIEQCTHLLTSKGLFSFIIPNLFFTSHYFRDLRQFLLEQGSFVSIFDLRFKVFERAEIGGNGIFVFTRDKVIKKTIISSANLRQEFDQPREFVASSDIFLEDKDSNFTLLVSPETTALTRSINQVSTVQLGNACTIYQGIITGDNQKFLSQKPSSRKWEKILRGRDIDRYHLEFGGFYVLYDPEKLWSNTKSDMFRVPEKLISRQTSDHLAATYDRNGYYTLDSTHVIHLKKPLFSLKYLLGVFNSRLLNVLYTLRVRESGRVFAQVKVVNLNPLPIRTINFSDPADKTRHDKMVNLVERMMDLNKGAAKAKNPNDKDRLPREIEATDRQIDQLVYELYGLTEEEIKIVETDNGSK